MELAALYDLCNRTRFGGRLPRARIEWQQPPGGQRAASTHPNSARGPSIWISPIFSIGRDQAWVRETLLHEMCHVEVGTGTDGGGGWETLEHGPRWSAAMLRLYEQGETWVPGHLETASTHENEKTNLLKSVFKAIDALDPSLSFAEVCQRLLWRFARRRGHKFGVSAEEIIAGDVRVVEYWYQRVADSKAP